MQIKEKPKCIRCKGEIVNRATNAKYCRTCAEEVTNEYRIKYRKDIKDKNESTKLRK